MLLLYPADEILPQERYNDCVKKIIISKLFLYRYRFVIGYIILGLAFTILLFLLPFIAQKGLSDVEINSATDSYYLSKAGILNGDLVDLPYRILQKFSIAIFGLTTFAIKLPSIIIGFYAVSFLGWLRHSFDYVGFLANSFALAWLKNSRRDPPQTYVLLHFRYRDVAFDFYTIYDLFCNFLCAIRRVATTSQIRS